MHSVSLRQQSWGMDVFMHLSNHWRFTALWKDCNFSSTANFPVTDPLPKDIFLHHSWRIWITWESQCPRPILISSLAGGSIQEEGSYMSNRWHRKFGDATMPIKNILPGTSLLLALDHVFSLQVSITKRKKPSHLAFILILPTQGIPDPLLNQFQP